MPLASPAAGAALIAARRHALDDREAFAREFWLIVSAARRDFANGRREAGQRGLDAVRYRLARAWMQRDWAWVSRLQRAEADLEALRAAP